MERPLDYLKNSFNHDWLIGDDSHKFNQLAEQLYLELTRLSQQGIPPKILLAESDPIRFLAGFIAACAAGCPVFLCNPNWVKQEWQQVFELVQPDLILGYGDWGLAIRNYYPSFQSAIASPCGLRPIAHPQWIMIPTGGSSGKIRFAIHTWETLVASVQGFGQYFQVSNINSFCVLPLYHVSGLMQFIRSFTTNGKLICLPYKSLEAGEIANITLSEFFISLVPTQLQRLLQNPELAYWLTKFKTVLLGGAPAWTELLEESRKYGIRLALTYGMTETASQIVTLKPEDFIKGYNNCGQVLPHAKVNISNKIGTLTVQAKSLFLGYYPEIFNHKEFQLDDVGFFDEQGYLNIIGRSSNKIITGGENVYPNEVEAAIRATNLVNDVCVIGVPDHTWGQVVTAIYVPSHKLVDSETIKAEIIEKLCKFKQPKFWILQEKLPRNLQGKINHEQLLEIATKLLQNYLFLPF